MAGKPDWAFNKDYIEHGVSGYRVSSDNRDVFQEVLRDAVKGEFDVLLVFMGDRIGRIMDEYTPNLKKLSKYVEVWTVHDGDITIRTHTDALKASIDGWNNENESIKISKRTEKKQRQMTTEGLPRGRVCALWL
jgi:DNA invertase Pin-like site-specific DNA recombinase